MTEWTFTPDQIDDADRYFEINGFVGFRDLLPPAVLADLRAGVEEAVSTGRLAIGETEMANNNDCIYAHPSIEAAVRHPAIVETAEHLIRRPIELQHAKFNAKPADDSGGGKVRWHQDYPFYPHTNFDLISCVIHLDPEDESAGPLRMINGSHKWGPQSHLDQSGSFAYECTSRQDLDEVPSTLLTAPAGTLSFHHVLTMHSSAPKARAGDRRLVIFQYRATDAVQLGGVIWRCHGLEVSGRERGPRYARFADGTTVELRGTGGRLIDLAGQMKPDS
jgi:phytanoyl-CoA hydroxylase